MTEGDSTATAGKPGADWPRAAEGIQLAGLAVFLLLNTTGALPWSFWLDAIALWPLLIMSAGIRIAFDRTRFRALVLLGPVILLGGLAWMASGARPDVPSGPWQEETASRPEGAQSIELAAALAGARLQLETTADVAPGHVVEGRSLHRNENARLEAEADGSVARVHLRDGSRHGVVFLPRSREHWDLRLPRELPLRVRLNGAGIGGRFDFTAGALEGLQAEGVFIGIDARLPAPRQDTEIRMNGVFNSMSLTVPEGTPVRVHGPGLPFNAKSRGVHGAEGRPGYDVNVQGVFNAVEVRADRGITPEPPPVAAKVPASPPPPEAPAPPTTPAHPPAEAPPPPPVH